MLLLQFQGLLCHVSMEFYVGDNCGKPLFDFGNGVVVEGICDHYVVI